MMLFMCILKIEIGLRINYQRNSENLKVVSERMINFEDDQQNYPILEYKVK